MRVKAEWVRLRRGAIVGGIVLSIASCREHSPVAPPPSPPVLTIVSGETHRPVAGARVRVGSDVHASASDGTIGALSCDLHPTTPVEISAAGFFERRTTLAQADAQGRFTLWPRENATGLNETFTREVISFALTRWRPGIASVDVVLLGPEDDRRYLEFPADLIERHRRAMTMLNAAAGGAITYGMPRPGRNLNVPGTVRVRIFPADEVCVRSGRTANANFRHGLADGAIHSATVTYCRKPSASSPSVGLILHEFGHTFGMAHSTSPTDVMYADRPAQVLSEREQLVMRLMMQRMPGNRFPDDGSSFAAGRYVSVLNELACE
jgi:hypothetical protein